MYNEKVLDHFENPRCTGEIPNADGVGAVGNPTCGDMTKIYIKVEGDKLADVKFKTFGCAAAIASSSIACELARGKTLDEALKLTGMQIVDELGGLPDKKIHCSLLAHKALRAAIKNYRSKQ